MNQRIINFLKKELNNKDFIIFCEKYPDIMFTNFTFTKELHKYDYEIEVRIKNNVIILLCWDKENIVGDSPCIGHYWNKTTQNGFGNIKDLHENLSL